MQVSRSLDRVRAELDDEGLVANAGLLAPASLAERLGLKDLLDEGIDLGDVAGHANPGAKAMTIIHAVLAGADSIDDCNLLRSGASAAVLGHRWRHRRRWARSCGGSPGRIAVSSITSGR